LKVRKIYCQCGATSEFVSTESSYQRKILKVTIKYSRTSNIQPWQDRAMVGWLKGWKSEGGKGRHFSGGKLTYNTMIQLDCNCTRVAIHILYIYCSSIKWEYVDESLSNLDRLVNFLTSVCWAWESKRTDGRTLGWI